MSSAPDARRVIAYVDGFNLYFGLKKAGFQGHTLQSLFGSVPGAD
jgi:hypothetical protein